MALYIDLSFLPRQIAEGLFSMDFTYNGDLDRVKEEVKQNDTILERSLEYDAYHGKDTHIMMIKP